MNIMRNDKVVLVNGMDGFKKVGETFEVANVTDTKVILRDVTSKVAVGAIDIDTFEVYFKKAEEVTGWLQWENLVDRTGNVIAHYRTNGKKVQVRTPDGYRAETTCNKGDDFNLFFGIQLAYNRCLMKSLNDEEASLVEAIEDLEGELNVIRSAKSETKHTIKMMINSLELPKEH
jgi:hypothetical protein